MKNLIFLHVPKCAGTTIITTLRGIYGRNLYHDASFRQIRRRHIAWPWQSELTFNEQHDSIPQGTECIVGHFTWMKYRQLQWPTFVFLRDPVTRAVSQYSAGENRELAEFEWFMRKGADSVPRMVGDLRQYFFVGLMEHFEESMRMLEWYSGLQFQWPLEHRNKAEEGWYQRKKYRPTPQERQLILDVNPKEVKLYKDAKERFEEQRREYGEAKKEAKVTA